MSNQQMAFRSAAATAAAIKAREVSPVEVVQAYLDRIQRLDSRLCSYITVCGDQALAAARRAERALSRGGQQRKPLLGVPIAVKDQFWTKGIRTTNGSRVYRDFIPAEDATVVKKLKQAGAILLGKLNLSELAMGGTQQHPFGIPRNPWALERSPGESSSGSGVALAAHLCAASLGEDTGGSGRGPAGSCNVVGLRPTFTRVSRHGITPMCWFLDTAAPMAKTVEDCGLLLQAIAGYDGKDLSTSRRPVPDYNAHLKDGVRGLCVGLIRELHGREGMHPEVKLAVEKALTVLQQQGAQVQEVSIPLVPLAGAIYVAVGDTEGAAARDQVLRTRPMDLDPATRTRLQAAALMPAQVYNRAMKARVVLRQQFLAALHQVDVLVSPTSPYPPPTHADLTAPFQSIEHVRTRFFFRRSYSASYSLASLPAISIPGGFTSDHLPIGLQLGGAPFAEATLLRTAHAYEQATPWHTMDPPLALE